MPNVIQRAFERPLTSPDLSGLGFDETIAALTADAPLSYTISETTRALTTNPGYDSKLLASTKGAAVKIVSERGYSSGFITHDDQGRQIVVTAAHAVGECTPESVQITDTLGRTTRPAEGYYSIEDQGVLLDPTRGNQLPEVDVAVLRPERDLGSASLTIGTLATRGTWLDMVNFHKDAPHDRPYHYKAVVLTGQEGLSNCALTGMEPERKNEPRSNYVVQRGASGGVMVDPESGDVAGVSFFAGSTTLDPAGLELVNTRFDVPIGGRTGIYPRLAFFLDPAYIHALVPLLK